MLQFGQLTFREIRAVWPFQDRSERKTTPRFVASKTKGREISLISSEIIKLVELGQNKREIAVTARNACRRGNTRLAKIRNATLGYGLKSNSSTARMESLKAADTRDVPSRYAFRALVAFKLRHTAELLYVDRLDTIKTQTRSSTEQGVERQQSIQALSPSIMSSG